MGKRKVKNYDPWIYKEEALLDIPEGVYGFIYEIECKSTGEKYIGKKAFHSYHTSFERVLNEKTNRMNKVRRVTATESNWKDYFGSSAEIKALVKEKGTEDFTRRILRFCNSKKALTYYELAEQCIHDVLNPENKYINQNILGKFFSSDLFEIQK